MNKNLIPQLSNEITFSLLNKNEYFIHQETYNHRVKITSGLYDFIILIDNNKNLQDLVLEYNTRYNSNLTIEFAFDFLYNKLAIFGIIKADNIKIKPNQKPNYIILNFIIFNEKFVAKFTKYFKYLFIPAIFNILLVISITVLIICFYFYSYQIFHTNFDKTQWFCFFLLGIVGITFHEFGHASAAHYYGAKHGGIGGGFYLFMPVYFADVTDIWKLPKKQRIIVNLGGIYFELLFVLILILTGYILDFKSLIIFASIFSISIIYNLNPIARTDGYWVLSDIIEKPNLMVHGYLRVKQIFKPKKNWKMIDYFLLFYGMISHLFIISFLYFLLIENPNSILFFPQNLYHFGQSLFSKNTTISLAKFGNLLIPLTFFYLLLSFLKGLLRKSTLKGQNYRNQ